MSAPSSSHDLAALVAGASASPEAAPVSAADPALAAVVVRGGTRWFALAATQVAEVVSLPRVTRVPGAAPHVLGVAVVRGRLVPVVDVEALLTRRPDAGFAPRRLVVARVGGDEIAIAAAQTRGIIGLHPPDRGSALERPAWIVGDGRWGEELVTWLDVPALVRAAVAA